MISAIRIHWAVILAGGYTSNTTQCLNNANRAWQTTGACRNQNQILVFIRLAVERWIVVKIECLKLMTSRQKNTCDKTCNYIRFVQLCTNKFQGLFRDLLRTNDSLQGLKIYSINWHNPLLNTLMAKTHQSHLRCYTSCICFSHSWSYHFILLSATTFSKWLNQVWLTCNYIWGTEISFDRDRN